MKKSLSLVLAAVLAFGGAVSAFAWPTSGAPSDHAKIETSATAYKWDGDNGYFTTMAQAKGEDGLKYGATFGFMITDGAGNAATKSDETKNIKAYPEYNMTDSKNLVEKVAVEYKKYEKTTGKYDYAYFATMKTKANATATAADLMGVMRVGKSSTDAKTRGGVEFGFTLDNNKKDPSGSYNVTSSTEVLDFNNQNDVDITFSGSGNDHATFTVVATG